jgi:hypothetical protein
VLEFFDNSSILAWNGMETRTKSKLHERCYEMDYTLVHTIKATFCQEICVCIEVNLNPEFEMNIEILPYFIMTTP